MSNPGLVARFVLLILVLAAVPEVRPAAPPLELIARLDRRREDDRLLRLANGLRWPGKLREAVAAARKLVEFDRRELPDEPAKLAGSRELLAGLLEQLAGAEEQSGRWGEAEKARKEVLEVRTSLLGEKHWQTTDARLALANTGALARLTPEQRKLLGEAVLLHQKMEELNRQGKVAEALALARKILDVCRTLFGEKNPLTAVNLLWVAFLHRRMKDFPAAEPLYQQYAALKKELLGERHPDHALALHLQADCFFDAGKFARAEPLYRRAAEIREQLFGGQDSSYLSTLARLAHVYRALGKPAQEEDVCRRAVEGWKARLKSLGGSTLRSDQETVDYIACLQTLAARHRLRKEHASAESLLREAVSKHPRNAAFVSCLKDQIATSKLLRDQMRREPAAEHGKYEQMLREQAAFYAKIANLHFRRPEAPARGRRCRPSSGSATTGWTAGTGWPWTPGGNSIGWPGSPV